jgi:hypothetical protein
VLVADGGLASGVDGVALEAYTSSARIKRAHAGLSLPRSLALMNAAEAGGRCGAGRPGSRPVPCLNSPSSIRERERGEKKERSPSD